MAATVHPEILAARVCGGSKFLENRKNRKMQNNVTDQLMGTTFCLFLPRTASLIISMFQLTLKCAESTVQARSLLVRNTTVFAYGTGSLPPFSPFYDLFLSHIMLSKMVQYTVFAEIRCGDVSWLGLD